MLEILLLYRLCSTLGNTLRNKGRSPLGYQFLLVFLWIAAEVTGSIFGYVIGVLATGSEDSAWLFAIFGALIGVTCAASCVFLIAHNLPDLEGAYDDRGGDQDNTYGPGWRQADRDKLRRFKEDGRKTEGDGITDHPEDVPRRRRDDRLQE